MVKPMSRAQAVRLRELKADFFKSLAHPLRIHVLELLRDGPANVGRLQEMTGVPASSLSQQLTFLRSRGILNAERHGNVVVYAIAEPDVLRLLDDARAILAAQVSDQADVLSSPPAAAGPVR
jgi:ArsR family transcriptional regulator, arsenate/arsenite/antimonite-responsive transcriptional repressor